MHVHKKQVCACVLYVYTVCICVFVCMCAFVLKHTLVGTVFSTRE